MDNPAASEPHKRTSMFLCKVLRHQPDLVGIKLDSEGWVDIDTLIRKVNEKGRNKIDRTLLDEIIRTDSKGRYEVDDTGKKIRCCHGHSVPVDLSSTKAYPPATLFHGTAQQFVASIRRQGLLAKTRQYVHLSEDRATAETVGARHDHSGRSPVVLVVDTGKMATDGYEFFLSHDRVWLTKSVPPEYLSADSPDTTGKK